MRGKEQSESEEVEKHKHALSNTHAKKCKNDNREEGPSRRKIRDSNFHNLTDYKFNSRNVLWYFRSMFCCCTLENTQPSDKAVICFKEQP